MSILTTNRAGKWAVLTAVLAAVAGCTPHADARDQSATPATSEAPSGASFSLTSSAFGAEAPVPKKYTCEGANTSPPLSWSGAPTKTESFALIMDDPDAPDPAAPKTTHVHWVLADIPKTVTSLAEGASPSALPLGTVAGTNDSGHAFYDGPCPPIGRHRYFHKLYALDEVLGSNAPTKADVERAMQGHVLGEAQLIGTYQKE